MDNDDRRLIEEYLPIGVISEQGDREKKAGRAYHPSTLHWWWARRPLASARAAVLASLVPANLFPADREEVAQLFEVFTRWKGDELGVDPLALDEARTLIKKAWPDQPPRVIDTFVGGGAIPLEAARLGCQTAGVELNPVAFMVATGTVVWPQTYGAALADDVEHWGRWVHDRAFAEVGDLYPNVGGPGAKKSQSKRENQLSFGDGERPTNTGPAGYLWTRTVPCPNPARAAHQAPLVRAKYVVRKEKKRIELRVVPGSGDTAKYELREARGPATAERRGRSSASACRLCGAVLSPEYLAEQGAMGGIGFDLLAVISVQSGRQGKAYISGSEVGDAAVPDESELDRRLQLLKDAGFTPPEDPVEPMGNAGLASGNTYLYGIKTFGDIFTKRQLVTLLTLCKYVRAAHDEMVEVGMDRVRADVVAAYLGLAVNRVVDRSTNLCRWHLTGEKAESPFVRDRLAMVWDFVEVNPFAGISGDFSSAIDYGAKVIRHGARAGEPVELHRGSATDLTWFEDGSFDAAIVDPPYYDNISYANSSDFYYVWLKRSVGHLFPEHFAGPVAPKRQEIVAAAYRHGKNKVAADAEYESMMTKAFQELRRVLKPEAPMVAVYAHQTTAGWSTLIRSLRASGFTVVEAWPIDTELQGRRGGEDNASLASSIFLVARRRESDLVGEWDEVQDELQEAVAERVRTLPELGVTGGDLVIATIGAGLRAYTRYKKVELPNGEPMEAEHFLDEVQTSVVQTILSDLMGVPRSGVEVVDPVTQLYVMGRFEYGEVSVPFDELNTLSHGVLGGSRAAGVELMGAHGLTAGAGALIAQSGSSLRFRDYLERGEHVRLGSAEDTTPPLIDALHRILWLAQRAPVQLPDYLWDTRPDLAQLQLVARALTTTSLSGKGQGTSPREQEAIQSLLAAWRPLIEEVLTRSR
jgi:putative DNA methylase